MQHYQFHIGDYVKDTAHLTDLEDLAYRRLLDLYYDTEGHIPSDPQQVARRIRSNVDAVTQVLSEFFYKTDLGEWKHHRCDQEIEKVYEKSEKARANAAASHAVRRAKATPENSERNADAMQTQSERTANALLPVTRNPSPVTQLETLSDSQANTDVVVLKNGKQKFKGDAEIVLAFLNEKTGRAYRPLTANLDFIAERLKEGATVADCRKVIAKKSREWTGTDMAQYLRPATLFNRTKFAQYVGELHVEQSPIGDYV